MAASTPVANAVNNALAPNNNASSSNSSSTVILSNTPIPYPRPALSLAIPGAESANDSPIEIDTDADLMPQQPTATRLSVSKTSSGADAELQKTSAQKKLDSGASTTASTPHIDASEIRKREDENVRLSNEHASLSAIATAIATAKNATDLPPIFVEMLSEAFEAVENSPVGDPEVLCTFCYK